MMYLDVKGKKILEVGSGMGRDSIYLAMQGADVYLLDNIDTPLRQAKDLGQLATVNTVQADAFTLPFADNTFDLVFSEGLLEHFKNPEQLLIEQRRVCKEGGFVIADVPQKYHLYTILKQILQLLNRWQPGWETQYSPAELKNLFKLARLEVVDVFGDWSYPALPLKILLFVLGKYSPKDPPADSFFKKWFRKTALAAYTYQNIAVIGRK